MATYIKSEHLGEMYDEDRSYMTPKRRKMIHDHRKKADLYGPELPFDFGIFKPKLGNKLRDKGVKCDNCGSIIFISKITYAVICSKCSHLIKINE